jgi:hypothetical protein
MSIKRSLFGLVAATLPLSGGLLAGAPGAFADGPVEAVAAKKRYCTDNNHGARACFQPAGDKLIVKDTDENGDSAVGVLKDRFGRTLDQCIAGGGKGDVQVCNYQFSEGLRVQFWAVNYDTDTGRYTLWSTDRQATA